MKRPLTLRPLLLLLALALALPARAGSFVLHPCVVSAKDKALADKLRTVCEEELARFQLPLPPSQPQVRDLLAQEPKGSCARLKEPERDACLGRLAVAAQASTALLVTVDEKDRSVSGLLVSAAGQYVDSKALLLGIRDRKAPVEQVLRIVLRYLRTQLALPKPAAPSTEPVAEPAPPATANSSQPPQGEPQPNAEAPALAQAEVQPNAEAPVLAQAEAQTTAEAPALAHAEAQPTTEPQAQSPQAEPLPAQASPAAPTLAAGPAGASPGATWRKPATYASLGAGGVAACVALLFALQSESNMRQAIDGFNAAARGQPGGVPIFPSESALQEQVGRYHQTALEQRLVAGVSTGLSAALLGVGAWLLFTEPAPPKPGTAALMVGPGSVGVRVLTP